MEPISVSGHDGDGDGKQAILDVHATQEARLEGLRAPAPLDVKVMTWLLAASMTFPGKRSCRRWTSAAQDLGRDSTVAV